MALLMCTVGFQLVKSLGSMLLMSYTGSGVPEVIREIEEDDGVVKVEEAKFWQVHYGLGMACLKVRVRGGGEKDEGFQKVRQRIGAVVRSVLSGASGGGGGGGGAGGVKGSGCDWEVSMQLVVERD